MSGANILLDSNIRDWVVLPLFAIMVAAGLLRFYMGNLLKPGPKGVSKVFQRAQKTLLGVASLKSGASQYLSAQKLEARRFSYPELIKEQVEWCENHLDEQDAAREAGGDDDMPNPFAAMEGMQGNMVFMVQNMVTMQAIQHAFSGYILLKVPFHLTMGFKQMFQRGLDGLSELDTSYVSSVSWYFLVMFGLRGFFKLVIGSPNMESMESQKLMSEMGKHAGSGSKDDDEVVKQLNGEAEKLAMALPKQFKSQLDSVEKRLLKNKYPKKKSTISNSDFLLHKSSKKNR